MISNTFVAVLLSVVFVVTAAYSIFRVGRSHLVRDRISYAFHTLMSAAMFFMIWSWGVELFLVPQIVIFSAATIWFVILAVTPANAEGHLATGHHDGPRKLLYHGGMMAAMVVMAFGMIGMSSSSMAMSGSSDMGAMPGMDMSGSGSATVAPLWVGVVSLGLAIGFGIAALYFVGSALAVATSGDGPASVRRFRGVDAGWNLLMAAGMAALFIPMVSFG